jgi:hypothetical protein
MIFRVVETNKKIAGALLAVIIAVVAGSLSAFAYQYRLNTRNSALPSATSTPNATTRAPQATVNPSGQPVITANPTPTPTPTPNTLEYLQVELAGTLNATRSLDFITVNGTIRNDNPYTVYYVGINVTYYAIEYNSSGPVTVEVSALLSAINSTNAGALESLLPGYNPTLLGYGSSYWNGSAWVPITVGPDQSIYVVIKFGFMASALSDNLNTTATALGYEESWVYEPPGPSNFP